MESICKHIEFMSLDLQLKVGVVIEQNATYRSVENYLCEHQINYCHYEHHQQVLDFNKNPSIMVCLIKSEHLLAINFAQPVLPEDLMNAKL